ncbi:MAG: AraC family transcriptional regulator ligand-binding domain-containing protein [Pseudomonadota bacterium]
MQEYRTVRDNGATDVDPDGGTGTIHIGMPSTVVAFALSRGMTADDIRAATGFDVSLLGNPDVRPPDSVVHHLWNALTAAQPDRPIPLEAAKAAPFSTLGGLAHGMQYAATMREAVAFSRRNGCVLADRLDISLRETASEAMLLASHPNDVIDNGCTAEMGAGVLARFIREVLGLKDVLRRVDLSHPARGPVSAYEEFFLCPVRFGAPGNAVVLERDALDTPVRMAEPSMFAFIEQHFDILRRQIETLAQRDPLSSLRRAITDSAAAGDYRAEAVSQRLGLRLRAAQRLAAKHGTTLANLIDEARRANAEAFLSDRSMSVQMVASVLGYSDDRAFRRAFKRWTGISPTDYRRFRS